MATVKQGFSWPGFFFAPIWLLLKRLWLYAAIFWILGLVVSTLSTAAEASQANGTVITLSLIALAMYFVSGFYGNSWREANLRSRGFNRVDSVSSETPDSAIAYLARKAA